MVEMVGGNFCKTMYMARTPEPVETVVDSGDR